MDSKNAFWGLAALAVFGIFAFLISGSFASSQGDGSASATAVQTGFAKAAPAGNSQALAVNSAGGSALAPASNGVQEVGIYVQGGNYYPNPIRVKKGLPVRLVADVSRIPGCAKSIVIPEFGIQKYVQNKDNVIEFTPDKSGTFAFSCSMGMYRGTIIVEEADGTVAAFTGNAPKVAAGSCGAGGGGCGCGG